VKHQRSQFIAHARFVPNRVREQALHAIRPHLPGVFSDLPTIFTGDLAQDGLQVEKKMLVRFGASKMGTQTLMQLVQAHQPTANRSQSWPGFFWSGMVNVLHAFLVSDGQLIQAVLVLLACHIGAPSA
jgi:hypothetical protein